MDPVTAIGLSLNVIELGKIFWKTAEFCIACYKDGTERPFGEIKAAAHDLKEVTTKLQTTSKSATLLPSNVDLQEICRHCCFLAKELDDEIEKLRITPGTLKALVKAPKIYFKRKHVEELKRKMDEQVIALHTNVLVHLR
ncbi:hypothetical protein PV11_06016 [Exophiala sideris]|uniref:Fungal N-terminal domain-containing protein n=1 Tax=Exophiala sideris TaxID=1016849 RepID=A0A0D1X8C0_9EURO|nr:hypothetical protein PV11_06016 [Exophiala sideris]